MLAPLTGVNIYMLSTARKTCDIVKPDFVSDGNYGRSVDEKWGDSTGQQKRERRRGSQSKGA